MLKEPPKKTAQGFAANAGAPIGAMLSGLHSAASKPNVAFVVQRVTYQTVPPLGVSALLTFTEPEKRVALLDEKEPGEWPKASDEAANRNPEMPDFDCICLDATSAGIEVIQRAEQWIDPQGASAANASVKVKIPGGWVRTAIGRSVVFADEAAWRGLLCALADFYHHEFELRKMERSIASDWGRAETDLPLANDVKPEDLNRLDDIGSMTRSVWMRRIRLAKMERPLAKSFVPLPEVARKLAARLRAKFDVADRVETLDGQIEVYEYIYEMANQRMGEYGNFRREYLLEILIVVLLAAELGVMLYECFRNFRWH